MKLMNINSALCVVWSLTYLNFLCTSVFKHILQGAAEKPDRFPVKQHLKPSGFSASPCTTFGKLKYRNLNVTSFYCDGNCITRNIKRASQIMKNAES